MLRVQGKPFAVPRRLQARGRNVADTIQSAVGRGKVFSSETRLRRHADFQHLRTHGQTAVGRYCVIRALVPPPDGGRRVGFVISRHYSGKAVVRNRCRRLFRESYRQYLPDLRDAWIEFRPRARMRGLKLAEVANEVGRLLGRLELWRSDAGGQAR